MVRTRALFVGLTTLDVVQYVSGVPAENEKVTSSASSIESGGPAANAAVTCRGLGTQSRLVTLIGRSQPGVLASASLVTAGIALTDACPPGSTWRVPISSVLVNEHTGDRAVASQNGSGAPQPVGVTVTTDGLGVVLCDGHLLDLALPIAQRARRSGVPVILDAGSWKTGLEQLLPLCAGVLASSDFRIPGVPATVEDTLDSLLDMGVRFAAISRGGESVVFASAEGPRGDVEVEPVAVVDTLGAGDVLHGAWAHHIATNGLSEAMFVEGLRFAADVASNACRFRGVRGWMAP